MNRLQKFLACSVLGGLIALGSSVARADDFSADPVHSFVVFDVHHLGAGYVYGTFAGTRGDISYDKTDATKTSFNLTVDVDSLDTRNKNRDKDLKGPDFFDVKQFPDATFKSTAVKVSSDNMMEVTGDFTMHGVTKSITLNMEMTGTGKGMKGETRIGFRTTFTINRADYGVSYDPPPVIGNDVQIVVAVEATQN